MVSRILAFRPASVVARLPPRSGACPLSGRELVGVAAELGLVLPVVRAPIAAVARGALVAAKELQAALGLSLPQGVAAARWFEGVCRAADEIAAGLPVFLCADVVVDGEGATQLDRATSEAWRLADAGLTHLAFDVGAVAASERGRVLAEVARATAERGVGVEVVVPLGDGGSSARAAEAMLEEAAGSGVPVDLASVRCPAPADDDEARLQAAALARMCRELGGVPVMRRGPVTPRILELLRGSGSPVKACEDGGAAAARAAGVVPLDAAETAEGGSSGREARLERAAAALSGEAADRLEAVAYVEATDLVERLGARGGALAVARALERRLDEG